MKNPSGFRQMLGTSRAELEMADSKPLYSDGEALAEANRCLFCYDAPCIKACPTSIDIPGFIRKIGTDNIRASATTIFKANMLGYSCARVCPVEELCAGACVYNNQHQEPIAIGRLQRYATERALADEARTGRRLFKPKSPIGKRVALIGAGPASLACAAYLALEGVEPVIFERKDLPGGLNTTGVAPYKLHSEDAIDEVEWLLNHGITVKTGHEIGTGPAFDELCRTFDAVFIGAGLGIDNHLDIPGREGPGYWGATELIERIKNGAGFQLPGNLMTVAVLGGGNTAIDIARELAMLGVPDVVMVYRRGESEMSGYRHELAGARHYGVRLLEHAQAQAVLRQNEAITGLRLSMGDPCRQIDLPCQWVVEAIGQEKHAGNLSAKLHCDEKGRILVDSKSRQTSIAGVFAGGDCINGGKEVVNAAHDGREAAFAMLRGWGITASLAAHPPHS